MKRFMFSLIWTLVVLSIIAGATCLIKLVASFLLSLNATAVIVILFTALFLFIFMDAWTSYEEYDKKSVSDEEDSEK